MRRILQALGCRPRRLERTRQLRKGSFTARQAKKHGGLSLRVRGNVVRALDLLTRRRNILRLIEAPRQHGRQDFGRIEKGLFLRPTFGKRILQIDELNQEGSVLLGFNGRGISDVHGITSLQLDARLALYRGKKTDAEIAGTMNGNRYGLSILGENMMAAMDAIERLTSSLQPGDHFFARHIVNSRSFVIYTQPADGLQDYAKLVHQIVTNDMLNGEVIRLDGAIRMAPK